MNNLRIDAKAKTIALELELAGEPSALQVNALYTLIDEGDKTFIELREVKTSKEWITLLAGEFLLGRRFEVPRLVRLGL